MEIKQLDIYQKLAADSTPCVYIYRHLPSYLSLNELKRLTKPRLKAYLRKHRHLEFCFNETTYGYSESDREFNSYWGTSVTSQFHNYFKLIKLLLNAK